MSSTFLPQAFSSNGFHKHSGGKSKKKKGKKKQRQGMNGVHHGGAAAAGGGGRFVFAASGGGTAPVVQPSKPQLHNASVGSKKKIKKKSRKQRNKTGARGQRGAGWEAAASKISHNVLGAPDEFLPRRYKHHPPSHMHHTHLLSTIRAASPLGVTVDGATVAQDRFSCFDGA